MRASTRCSRGRRAGPAAFAWLLGLTTLACAHGARVPASASRGLIVGTLSNEQGKNSFGAAFHGAAQGLYEGWFAGLTSTAFPACNGAVDLGCLNGSRHPLGADVAHVLAVEAHGQPDEFFVPAGNSVQVKQLQGLGRRVHGSDGALRYLWLVACNVMAHGPEFGACPGAYAGLSYGAPVCYQPGGFGHADAVARWRPVLEGSGLRMVCGGVSTIRGTQDEAAAMWQYLGNDVPPADAFMLGALAHSETPNVPACLARGPQAPEASPLYDGSFTTDANPLGGDWYHLQYPVWVAPGAPPPAIDWLPETLPRLRPKPPDAVAECGDVGSCGRVAAAPALPATSPQLEPPAARFDAALALGRGNARLTRRPRLIDVYIDSYCGAAACDGVPLPPGARRSRRRGSYAVFDRVVRVCLKGDERVDCSLPDPQPSPSPSPSPEAVHEHGSAKAPPAEVAAGDAQIVEHEIPELGAGGRVVAQIDAQGAVTRVWRHLPPVSGPWRPRADERVVQPRDARERAAVELRARLGRGEVAADPRLETWGFRDVGGELRPFYVFEYLVTSRAGGERVLRIEVAALLRGAGGRRDAHAH